MNPDAGYRGGPNRAVLLVAAIAIACAPAPIASNASPPPSASTAPPASAPATSAPSPTLPPDQASIVIVGRIVTMDDPSIAEALFIEDGLVRAVGQRAEVLTAAGDDVPVVDIGTNVAYPGFIDAHAHWIGDRHLYNVRSPAEAMDLAVTRGWTSISEHWVNQERYDELTSVARNGALRLRIDAYLALNYDKDFYGDWYTQLQPGPFDDRLRVQGLKIHLDDGSGTIVNWEPDELTATIGKANEAGWQVSVHSMSSPAQELVLDAFEAALGPAGPNPLHHRIEHVIEVTDEELARMVALDLAVVIHPDGEGDWMMYDGVVSEFDRQSPPPDIAATFGRWRDFIEAGLHVAFATDAPWTFPESETDDGSAALTDDMGRAIDHIAAGMDGRQREHPDMPGWLLDQLLTADQGLRAVTLDAAWALGDESRRGHLAAGTLGDVTILSGDLTGGATPDDIRAMDVIATIVGGVPEYCPDSTFCAQLKP